MPEKRLPQKVTEKDREELEKVTAGLKKREIKYPEPEDGSLIVRDSACVTYPEPKGGDLLLKREGVDTHRVELKKIRPVPKVKIASPGDVVNFVKEMEDYDRERFKAIHFDTKNRVLGVENIAEGTLNSALVHPRETAKGAILNNAAGVIIVHNHPSGISQPSHEDDVLISKLRDAFKMLSIEVLDAIVIGKEGYYSYKEDMRLERMTEGGSQRIMEPKVKENSDACSTALMAAMETMNKYCGEGATEIDERPLIDRYRDFTKELRVAIEKLPTRKTGGFERAKIYAEEFNRLKKKYDIPNSIPKELIEEVGDILGPGE